MSNVKDSLSAEVVLSRIIVLVGEWIPFGCNQITELSLKLGVRDRIKGGVFSERVDMHSTETTLETDVGLTNVYVNSYSEAEFLNVEAQVDYPEASGVVQVEHFGIRYQRDGITTYGFKVEAIMDKVLKKLTLVSISRVMVDIHIDSSKVGFLNTAAKRIRYQ